MADAAAEWSAAGEATLAVLRHSRLFSHLPDAVLRRVALEMRPRRVRRGAFLFLEGEPAEALNVLASGRVKVVRETDDGREVIIRLVGRAEIFGGAGGWGEATYPASARALEDAVVLRLPADRFADLIQSEPAFAAAVVAELAERLREAESRIRELQTERVERRIARVLLRLANKTGRRTEAGIEIGVPLTRQDLAELSGTTLSTASRTLSHWDEQGIVAAGRERVTIVQPHALVSIAEELEPGEGGPTA